MTEKKLQEWLSKADSYLADFDFEAVHKHMEETNWTWRGEDKAPSIKRIKQTADRELKFGILNFADTGKASSNGTGGFKVYVFPYGFSLHFSPRGFNFSSY